MFSVKEEIIVSDNWMYTVRTRALGPDSNRCHFSAKRLNSQERGLATTPIDYCYRPNSECVITYLGDTYHFGSMGQSPIMAVRKNPESWKSYEEVIPTRERLIQFLDKESFVNPTLIFLDTRLYSTWNGIPRLDRELLACREFSEMIGNLAKQLEFIKTSEQMNNMVTYVYDHAKKLKDTGVIVRYLPIEGDLNFQSDTFVRGMAPVINTLFFELGVVLIFKRSKHRGVNQKPYSDNEGPQYYDLKMLVDKRSIFDESIDNGWDRYLQRAKDREQPFHCVAATCN